MNAKENMTQLDAYLDALGERASKAAGAMRFASTKAKNATLETAAKNISRNSADILAVNAKEVSAARENGLSEPLIDRMMLSEERVNGICSALYEIVALKDPVGEVISRWKRPNGLHMERVCTPIGVIAVIYESRPNVTIDAAAITLKAGNAVILRGGSECIETSKALFDCFRDAMVANHLPDHAAQFVDTPDRDVVGGLLSGLNGRIDLVVPRGGKSLVARVQKEARVPVLSHLDGINHVYVDASADEKKAVEIVVDSKMRRTSVCGAAETLLIDRAALVHLWPAIAKGLRDRGCEIRGDAEVQVIDDAVIPATEEDWSTEYLAPIISVAVVDGVDGALEHLRKYSSGHTDAIVAEDKDIAERFLNGADSAIVLHNASTQFADGGEFGFGGEIGIATGKLHARGPVSVAELTTYKNIVRGNGHIRA